MGPFAHTHQRPIKQEQDFVANKGLFLGSGPHSETGKLMLRKTRFPDGFQSVGFIGAKLLIMVTEGVRVVVRALVSTDWSALGAGSAPLVLTSAVVSLMWFPCLSGPGSETQLRPTCSLWFDRNSILALYLRLRDANQNLIVLRA